MNLLDYTLFACVLNRAFETEPMGYGNCAHAHIYKPRSQRVLEDPLPSFCL